MKEYIDGALVKEDKILSNDLNTIYKINYDSTSKNNQLNEKEKNESKIKISDIVAKNVNNEELDDNSISTLLTAMPDIPSNAVSAGGFYYRYNTDTSGKGTKVNVKYKTEKPYNTSYDINHYVGDIIDLAAALIGALALPASVTEKVAGTFIKRVLSGLGVSFAVDKIKEPFSDVVYCEKVTYHMYAWHEIAPQNVAYFEPSESSYKVIDGKKHIGQTYYEDMTAKNYKTNNWASYIMYNLVGSTDITVTKWF